MQEAATAFLGRALARLQRLSHNEMFNFAVSGGVFGIAIYIMLLGMPIAACLRSPRDSQFRARLYGCSLLTVSYFVLGLPDTMLSFELHTALYVALTAVLLAFCRDPDPLGTLARSEYPIATAGQVEEIEFALKSPMHDTSTLGA